MLILKERYLSPLLPYPGNGNKLEKLLQCTERKRYYVLSSHAAAAGNDKISPFELMRGLGPISLLHLVHSFLHFGILSRPNSHKFQNLSVRLKKNRKAPLAVAGTTLRLFFDDGCIMSLF